jgi:hypothetical protein
MRTGQIDRRTLLLLNLTLFQLLDLGGDIAGDGLSKLLLTIAAALAKAERDRLMERKGQVKAAQKVRWRHLGGKVSCVGRRPARPA